MLDAFGELASFERYENQLIRRTLAETMSAIHPLLSELELSGGVAYNLAVWSLFEINQQLIPGQALPRLPCLH